MKKLYEAREWLVSAFSRYEQVVIPALKFLTAVITFTIINHTLGYMEQVCAPIYYLAVSLLCCMMPWNAIAVFAAILVLVHLYALSLVAFLVGLALVTLLFLLYYRFTSESGIFLVLTPIAFYYQIPYMVPMTAGLLQKPHTALSVLSGTICYFFLKGVKENEILLAKHTKKEMMMEQVDLIWNQLLVNRELYLMLLVMLVTVLTVYFLRSMSMNYAWTTAILMGAAVEVITVMAGHLMMGIEIKPATVFVGIILAVLWGWLLQFFCFNLDYSHTERVQFEDEEYYYYVKAVPKIFFPKKEKKKKTIRRVQDKNKDANKNANEDMKSNKEG